TFSPDICDREGLMGPGEALRAALSVRSIRYLLAFASVVLCAAIGIAAWPASGGHVDRPYTVKQHVFVRRPPSGLTGRYVADSPHGFVQERRDPLTHSATGTQLLGQASSGVCGGVSETQLQADRWVASRLYYWDNAQARRGTYLMLCLTQLASTKEAAEDLGQVSSTLNLAGTSATSSPLELARIPGATGSSMRNSTVRIAFSRGRFVVLISAGGTSGEGSSALSSLATNLAESELHRLAST
ncbi:MAG: hypothetical protein ACRDVP_03365, partial [Acidimicrobiales bacterium]